MGRGDAVRVLVFWGVGLIDSIVRYDFTLYGVIGRWVVGEGACLALIFIRGLDLHLDVWQVHFHASRFTYTGKFDTRALVYVVCLRSCV